LNFYLKKYGYCSPQLEEHINKDVNIIVVIPCFNEPDLITSLNTLLECDKPNGNVEVITVINACKTSSFGDKEHNVNTFNNAKKWAEQNNSDALKFHFILNNELPKKHAGVGLARKIGMDEAVYRFHSINKEDGIIVCFDADSKCEKNYLIEIEKHFNLHPKTPGCSIHYEHPIEGNEFDLSIYEGIINYELFLRYYNQALLYCNLPYAFQTVGSSMAVKSYAYQKQGGMNKRKAGEDFYFMHKIIALGGFTNLTSTKVIPSPRISDRVPFGTGRAIGEWVNENIKVYKTYDFNIWRIIKAFVEIIPLLEIQNINEIAFFKAQENQVFIDFLTKNNFLEDLIEIKKNSTNTKGFIKRFYVWFNAFRLLKVVHYLRDNQYPNQPIYNEAKLLAKELKFYNNEKNVKDLLLIYRVKEKGAKLP
jgi:mRNA-degrading endonuclease YafQ of YafQ-DinJ toxin-antitoxin module